MTDKELAAIQTIRTLADYLLSQQMDALPTRPGEATPYLREAAHDNVQGLLRELERLRTQNAALRDIVDRLAYEDKYRDPNDDTYSSMAELSRLIDRARQVLAEQADE